MLDEHTPILSLLISQEKSLFLQAKKIMEHKRKQERKREEKELKERKERIRKAKEEHERARKEEEERRQAFSGKNHSFISN